MIACVFESHPWGLYILSFLGMWHLIGIPPIKTWFHKDDHASE